MTVEEATTEIESTVEGVIDVARKRDADRKAASRTRVCRKALGEVQRVAGGGPMRALGDWIRVRIRETEAFPSSRAVRKKGAEICRNSGNEVSTGSWLGA